MREQLIADGFLDVLAAAVMRRGIMSMEAEIAWHDELDAALAAPGAGELPAGPPDAGTLEATEAQRTALGITGEEAGEPAAQQPPAAGRTTAGE